MRIPDLHALPAPLLLVAASIVAPARGLAEEAAAAIQTASPTPDKALVHTTNTPDNLTIEHTKELTCTRPTRKGDKVWMNYRGTLQSDGSEFDSSYGRDTPFSFRLGKGEVIKGWDEGLLDMCVGEQRKLIIPAALGYGDHTMGPIPAGSVLIFETELMKVAGLKEEDTLGHAIDQGEDMESEHELPTADVPPVEFIPPVEADDAWPEADTPPHPPPPHESGPPPHGSGPPSHESGPEAGPISAGVFTIEKNECRLLGPFALFVQGALGLLALLSLVFKRWRERPRRPVKVWFFDVSKQIVGTFLLHLANLAMSEFSSGSFEVQGKEKEFADASKDHNGRQPNPCSFYLLNLAIDTTVGIPVLIILLKVLHILFRQTPLANPPESIESGHYSNPPRVSWWMKQSLIYFIGLLGMKLFVLLLFSMLPWLGWVGDWALRWTEGNEALQIAFVMFIFPVCMNAIQYYIIDGVIKGKGEGGDGRRDREGFERVAQEDSEDGHSRRGRSIGSEEDRDDEDEDLEAALVVENEGKGLGKAKEAAVDETEADLEEVNPTPLPAYDESRDGAGGEGSEVRKK